MQKLIKLNDQHYIIVDDSEIKEGEWAFNYFENSIKKYGKYFADDWFKITHSTQPELLGTGWMQSVLPLFLSEVQEAINGYSVDDFAWNNPILSRKDVYDLFHKVFKDRRLDGEFSLSASKQIYQFDTELREISKIKSHQELVKDKLFIAQDVIDIVEKSRETGLTAEYFITKHLLPKTEWDIEIDEQGKISLAT